MSRWSAYRCLAPATDLATVVVSAFVACGVLSGILLAGSAAPAGASGTTGLSIKATPDRNLVNGQVVTVSGRGLARTDGGTNLTWFATECTAAVRGRMNLTTDTPHCDVAEAQAIRVGHNGTFSTKFRVRSGIVGDGYCGTPGHASCVIAVGTVKGQGTVAKISFVTPSVPPTSATTSTTTTTSG
jgi:hypothetical protein